MIDLFPDQATDVESLRKAHRRYRSVIYQLPTGGGKTVVAGYIMSSVVMNGGTVLVLVHRKELISQFIKTLREAGFEDSISVIGQKQTYIPWAKVHVAMVMSLVRRAKTMTHLGEKVKLVVIDECHHARAKTWENILITLREHNSYMRLLGLSATPRRTDGKGMGNMFDGLVCGLSVEKLIEHSRLAPVRVKRIEGGGSRKGVRRVLGELDRKELDKRADAGVVACAVRAYRIHAPGRKAIFFGVSRRHSRAVADRFKAEGVPAVHVDGNTDDAVRNKAFTDFHDGKVLVLCNVDLAAEGVDVPDCEVVLHGQHTASVIKWMQACGRGMRYREHKECLILDLVGNSYFLGLPTQDRDWTLKETDDSMVSDPRSASNLRYCEHCCAVFPNTHDYCPQCGKQHDGRPVVEVDAELVEILPGYRAKKRWKERRLARELLLLRRSNLNKREQFLSLVVLGGEFDRSSEWAHTMANFHNIPKEMRDTVTDDDLAAALVSVLSEPEGTTVAAARWRREMARTVLRQRLDERRAEVE